MGILRQCVKLKLGVRDVEGSMNLRSVVKELV